MAARDHSEQLIPNKKNTLVTLQWLLAIVASYLILFSQDGVSQDPLAYGLIVVFLASGLVLYRVPEPLFYHRYFDVTLMLYDTLLLCGAIMINEDLSWDLFLFYFFVLFLAAMGGSMIKIVVGTVFISLIYVGLLVQQEGGWGYLGSEVFIRVTFLFSVSILYGYLAENTNKERERAEMVEQRERLKMDLVSALAHDIKNPLGVIMGYTEIMIDQAGENDEIRTTKDVCNRIQSSVNKIVNLVTGFIEASRAEVGKIRVADQPVQVNRLIREAARQQEGDIQKKGLTLDLQLDENLPDVVGDESQIDRVFWNLIGNAVKFTQPGGKITIRSHSEDHAVCVAVEDTGIGISKEDLPRLFTQFQRMKGSEKIEGSGLGLFIVKTIVDAHKGKVWAESKSGEGSTFKLRLSTAS